MNKYFKFYVITLFVILKTMQCSQGMSKILIDAKQLSVLFMYQFLKLQSKNAKSIISLYVQFLLFLPDQKVVNIKLFFSFGLCSYLLLMSDKVHHSSQSNLNPVQGLPVICNGLQVQESENAYQFKCLPYNSLRSFEHSNFDYYIVQGLFDTHVQISQYDRYPFFIMIWPPPPFLASTI